MSKITYIIEDLRNIEDLTGHAQEVPAYIRLT